MPRYFFNVSDGAYFPDKEGSELPDDAAARTEALAASGEMLKSVVRNSANFWNGEEWLMEVVHESGTTVATIRFSASIPARQKVP
ncbi:hypothetical protein [Mesorhizobium sp.]|uniref:DUF6894 family protein n=1 Tax=Mesorhizobium sp. TaxID=1871066 RepID=UPI000FE4BE88|nr:hypothetical protein [Mesorhizobium sp.]RWP11009.1 MAG: hypothetical protein EOQ97_11250 [Mesorhizobium sp.]